MTSGRFDAARFSLTAWPCLIVSCLILLSNQTVLAGANPVLELAERATFAIRGPLGERIDANVRHWLLTAPDANQAMLQMFRDRDRTPPRELLPWSGEFAGKYLISATQALRLTRDEKLEAYLRRFVAELIATLDKDGYLGPFPRKLRMTGKGLWDLWGQYHVMLGLLRWYELTGDQAALAACRRCANLFCSTFLDGQKRVIQAGSEEMNEASIHIFTLLYRATAEPRYLRLAHAIEKDWQTPPSGDYLRTALAGTPFYKTPKPRWESLPSLQALAELYFISGDQRYRRALTQMWWSILEGDRHNTGGFSSGEQATGNPYDPRAIETCCTIAWTALTLDYLRLTGDARAADELELSTWNAVLGAQSAGGRWWTYNTPMDGERRASTQDIAFQARPGSSELNCCSVNGPRGLGILSEWAIMTAPDGITLNYYGPSTITVPLRSGDKVQLTQETDYPVSGRIRLTVSPDAEQRFVLRLRIPGWSRHTTATLNESKQDGVRSGTYLTLDRKWKRGDTITLNLDMSPRLWVGEREAAGKVALYRGPLLLAYDPRFDHFDPRRLPVVDPNRVRSLPADPSRSRLVRLQVGTADGGWLALCDFASAGAGGNRYVSWLPVRGFKPAAFSRDNPLRSIWPDAAHTPQPRVQRGRRKIGCSD